MWRHRHRGKNVMLRWRWRLKWYKNKPKECRLPPQGRRKPVRIGNLGSFLRDFRRSETLLTSSFQTCSFRTVREQSSVVLSHPMFGSLLGQPEESNTKSPTSSRWGSLVPCLVSLTPLVSRALILKLYPCIGQGGVREAETTLGMSAGGDWI